GHLALEIKDRVDRGEDPASARFAAVKDFGNLTLTRESIRAVWRPRWFEAADALVRDLRFAFRSLMRVKGLAATVVVTLALGIGANAAIFSVVRGVLLRPLVNRDEDRLLYVRQSAPSLGVENMDFSVPEIADLRQRAKTVAAFGDFSTVDFALNGLGGEPRMVKAGVVNGSFFDVMGLRPIAGRLLTPGDDGPAAAPVAVLTYRFWTKSLGGDPAIVGKVVRLGSKDATIVGVLEPSVPYPADTELLANVVCSPHHLGATMVTSRTHRMTELFARIAPGVSLDAARADLAAAHASMMSDHPDAYNGRSAIQLTITKLRDQISAQARTILLALLVAAGLVFVIACSNVANLILARSVRREGELAVRAALGAGDGALRRTLLAESLLLCGAGALLGVLLARPFVTLVAEFAARFSVRALDVRVDSTVVWVGAALALVAAVLLAYVPRLPSASAPGGLGLATGGVRITPGTNRRLRVFATMQIAFSFVLLTGAGVLLAALVQLQKAHTGFDTRQVLAVDTPAVVTGGGANLVAFYRESMRRVAALPGVDAVSVGNFVPWRDAGSFGFFEFTVDGYKPADGEPNPHARFRLVGPRFFNVVGLRLVDGREYTDEDGGRKEMLSIVSQSIAQRFFPNGHAVNGRLAWKDPTSNRPIPTRVIGVVADVDDEHVDSAPALTLYLPSMQMGYAGRLFVRTGGDPHNLVPAITRIIRSISPDQPVERAATLEDIRVDVLGPERVNAFVVSGFAGIGLLIAVVGVAGVLAFSVSARTREFGIRLAVGSAPRDIMSRVLAEGTAIAAVGIAAGAVGGYALVRAGASLIGRAQLPGMLPTATAALLLTAAAVAASLLPAARAARVDVLQALRSE